MTHPVRTVNMFASVHSISKLLLGNTHGGFPVVGTAAEEGGSTFAGLITRSELVTLLAHFNLGASQPDITYDDLAQVHSLLTHLLQLL